MNDINKAYVLNFIKKKSSEYNNELILYRLYERFNNYVQGILNERPNLSIEDATLEAYSSLGNTGFRKWYRELFESINKSIFKEYWQVYKQVLFSKWIIIPILISVLYYFFNHYIYNITFVDISDKKTLLYFAGFIIMIFYVIISIYPMINIKNKYGKDSIPYFMISMGQLGSPFILTIILFNILYPNEKTLLNENKFSLWVIITSILLLILSLILLVRWKFIKNILKEYSFKNS